MSYFSDNKPMESLRESYRSPLLTEEDDNHVHLDFESYITRSYKRESLIT